MIFRTLQNITYVGVVPVEQTQVGSCELQSVPPTLPTKIFII